MQSAFSNLRFLPKNDSGFCVDWPATIAPVRISHDDSRHMTVIISHQLGIEYFRNLRSRGLPRPKRMEAWLDNPERGIQMIASGRIDLAQGTLLSTKSTTSMLSASECDAVLWEAKTPTCREFENIKRLVPLLSDAKAACHVVIGNPKRRGVRSYAKSHLLHTGLWDGALWHIADDVFVCSPELLFAQMACVLPRPILVRLGLELCGGYCIQPESDSGFDNVYAIALPDVLSDCLSKMVQINGAREGRIAASRILPNSASPAEANLYIFICFPRREGGYGLPKPVLNARVDITSQDGKVHPRFCDMLWSRTLDVEYLGAESHAKYNAFLNDATRQGELAAQGIRIVPVTSEHTASISKMDTLAASIATILGIRRASAPAIYREQQFELHSLLYPWAH